MRTKVQLCQCKQCKANKSARHDAKKQWVRNLRHKTKQFLKGQINKDPLDNHNKGIIQYTD